ncbi:MAG: pyrroloquinoline quinone biosynthesis peptide chaperone PqqD [Pseudomonadota bacterium]
MTPEDLLPGAARPTLLRGVRRHWDKVRGTWVLLAPERALILDEIGAAVLGETDGKATFDEIVQRLAEKYAAPPEQIAGDTRRFLVSLIQRRMAEARP